MNADDLLAELDREAVATRRVLERVPGDRLAWRPHPKGMTLGQLAWHVATIPGSITRIARTDGIDFAGLKAEPRSPERAEELLPALEAGLADAREFLRTLTPEAAKAPWRMTANGREAFTLPKVGVIRTLLLNHWYHHRGELVVYFRCLDVPVPAVYGRSADESPLD
ncbi:MAG TPA: DinB family protein [Gemmatimonadales bacterium]|nr:DinB family protein [Gemmatimonadales bacterium]